MIVRGRSLSSLEFDGLAILDYTAGLALDASLAVIHVPPGARHAEAWSRRSDKYYLVTEDEIRFVLAAEPVTLARGDFCFVRRGRRFSYANRSGAPATLVLVHTPPFDIRDEVFVESPAPPG
ncbi:MAG TPA: cupin domain-containing protein [Gammaproteobacteria bacterium]